MLWKKLSGTWQMSPRGHHIQVQRGEGHPTHTPPDTRRAGTSLTKSISHRHTLLRRFRGSRYALQTDPIRSWSLCRAASNSRLLALCTEPNTSVCCAALAPIPWPVLVPVPEPPIRCVLLSSLVTTGPHRTEGRYLGLTPSG